MVEITVIKNETASNGDQITLEGLVEEVTWEVWTSNSSGSTACLNLNRTPVQFQTVSWSHSDSSGTAGHLTTTTSMTDGQGRVSNMMTLGATPRPACTVYLTYLNGNAEISQGSYYLEGADGTLPPQDQTWTFSHTSLSPSFLELDFPTSISLSSGQQIYLPLRVTGEYIEHFVSNLGETQSIVTAYSQPMPGVPVQLVIEEGDGQVSEYTSVSNSSGEIAPTFTMGTSLSRLKVILDRGPNNTPMVHELTFTPMIVEEVFTYSHSYNTQHVQSLESQPSSEESAVEISATIFTTTIDVYVSNLGQEDHRAHAPVPAPPGIPVTFTLIEGGGASLSPEQSVTGDSDGIALTTCHFANANVPNVRVRATVGQPGQEHSQELEISQPEPPETWHFVRTEGTLSVSLNTDTAPSQLSEGSQVALTAEVIYQSWEWWESNLGNGKALNPSQSAAHGATVTFQVESGNGNLSQEQTTTDSAGLSQTLFTSGDQDSRVTVHVSFGGAEAAGALDFTVANTPVWIYSHTEDVGLSLTLRHHGGQQVEAEASISREDVYYLQSDPTQTQRLNPTTGPAIGAEVSFSFDSGSMDPAQVYADANGLAYSTHSNFPYGQAGTVTATAQFSGLTVTASLEVYGEEQTENQNDDGTDVTDDSSVYQMENQEDTPTEEQDDNQTLNQTVNQTTDQSETDSDDQEPQQTEEDQTEEEPWVIDESTIRIKSGWTHKVVLNNATIIPIGLFFGGCYLYFDGQNNIEIIWRADAEVQYRKQSTGETQWRAGVRERCVLSHLAVLDSNNPITISRIEPASATRLAWNTVRILTNAVGQSVWDGAIEELNLRITQSTPGQSDKGSSWYIHPTPPSQQ